MGEIVTKDDLKDIWLRSGGSQLRLNYAMSILLGRDLIIKISNNIYYISSDGVYFDMNQLYWKIVTKLIKLHSPSGGVIGSEKAIEFHIQNFSIPDILIIYTRDTSLRIKLSDSREIHFRTLVSGMKTDKKNLWRTIVDNSIEIQSPERLMICGYELSLLESLSLRRHDIGIEESNIIRFLRLYESKIDRKILGTLTKMRYIRPLNRLRIIARDLGYEKLYRMTLDIIRDEGGGCYLNL
ncbi:hypothetical protein K2X92_05525 [Candidatus Gracilibacteria bacterium]|nr:hypothetical protein [Candidatus Gracilibacteria bacterium]